MSNNQEPSRGGIAEWMRKINSRINRIERALIRRSPSSLIIDPDNPLLRLEGREEFRTVSGGSSNGNHWAKIATIQIFNRYNDAQLLFTATARGYGDGNRLSTFIFARVKQQADFGSHPYARITIYPGGGQPAAENLRLVVIQNTPTTLVEIYLRLGSYTLFGIKPIHAAGSGLNVEWHDQIPSVENPPAGIISHTATYAEIDRSSIPSTGWTSPTLLNGWTNTNYAPLRYIEKAGVVEIRGRVNQGTASDVFTLPVDYRPLDQIVFLVDGGGTGANARMVIEPTGRVWLAGRTGTSGVISFAGILFHLN